MRESRLDKNLADGRPLVNCPLVSVVVPTLDSGNFLEEALQSILDQDYPRIECWVMDGGSQDETLDILRAYEGSIHWISEPDRGQAHALNKGFCRAGGEVFAWLNADDRYLPGAVSGAVEYLVSYGDIAAVYGDMECIDAKGRLIRKRQALPFDLNRLLNYYNYIPQMSTFFRKEAWEKAGRLDETLHYCMDYDLWIRIGRSQPMGYFPQTLAQWRIHEGSKTSPSPLVAMPERLGVSRRHGGRRFSPMWMSACLWRIGGTGMVRWGLRFLEKRWRKQGR